MHLIIKYTLLYLLSTFFLKMPTDEDCIICLPEHRSFVSKTNNKVVKEIIGEGELAYLIITCWKNMNVFEVIQENHLNCACSVSWDIYTHDKYSNIICFCTGGRKHRLLFTNFRNLNQLRKQLCYITTNHSRFYNSSVSSINLHSYFHKENHVMSYNVHFQI